MTPPPHHRQRRPAAGPLTRPGDPERTIRRHRHHRPPTTITAPGGPR